MENVQGRSKLFYWKMAGYGI